MLKEVILAVTMTCTVTPMVSPTVTPIQESYKAAIIETNVMRFIEARDRKKLDWCTFEF